MKFLLITGDHPRHMFIADVLCKNNFSFDWIIEKRERHIPKINKKYNSNIRRLFKHHFEMRYDVEKKFFGDKPGARALKNVKNIERVMPKNLNKYILKSIKKIKSKNLITYGCGLLENKILKLFNGYKLNVHAGLSPRYRGAATHFWPTYLMEPEYTGVTLHQITDAVDGGNIFHQTSIKIYKNFGIHDNGCLAIKNFSTELPKVLKFIFNAKKKIKGFNQIKSGRIWTEQMWTPLTLKMVYDLYNDKINEYCLKNRKIKKVKLRSVLGTKF